MHWQARLFITLLLLLLPAEAKLDSWNVEVVIDADKSTEWISSFYYNEPVQRDDLFILARITGVEVKADGKFIDCQTSVKDIGTSVICQNIYARNITYRFRALGLINDLQGLTKFEYRFSVIQLVGNLSITVRLPPGAGLVERSRLEGTGFGPFEPAWGRPDSDGRNIFVAWSRESPLLGSDVDIKIIYENVFENQLLPLGIIGMLAFGLLFVLIMLRRRPMQDILPVLTDSERKVVEILLREKKPVDQRLIVRETDYSKPKVSRIISNLEIRGLVMRSRKGRTNVIALSQSIRKPEKPASQNTGK